MEKGMSVSMHFIWQNPSRLQIAAKSTKNSSNFRIVPRITQEISKYLFPLWSSNTLLCAGFIQKDISCRSCVKNTLYKSTHMYKL